MSGTTYDAGAALVKQLVEAGLRATQDPRNVQPPAALLDRPAMIPLGNACANRQVEWTLHIVGKGADNAESWKRLDGMVDTVFSVLGPTINSCDPDTYPLNDTTDAPSYRVVFTQII